MERLLDRTGRPLGPVSADEAYLDLDLPVGVGDRPYLIADMIATLDGRAVFGGPGSTWKLGSDADHRLFRSLRRSCDAVIMGAGVVAIDDPIYPPLSPAERERRCARGLRPEPLWVVVSGHARLSPAARLFRGGAANVWVAVDERADPARRRELERGVTLVPMAGRAIDLTELLQRLKADAGVRRLCAIGGPTLNGGLLEAGLLDELFLTLSPHLPGGPPAASLVEGLSASPSRALELVSVLTEGQEVYLRYRVPKPARP